MALTLKILSSGITLIFIYYLVRALEAQQIMVRGGRTFGTYFLLHRKRLGRLFLATLMIAIVTATFDFWFELGRKMFILDILSFLFGGCALTFWHKEQRNLYMSNEFLTCCQVLACCVTAVSLTIVFSH